MHVGLWKVQKASIEVAAKVEHQMQLMDHMKQRLDVQDAVDLLVSTECIRFLCIITCIVVG